MYTQRLYSQRIAFNGQSDAYRRQSQRHRKWEKEYLNPEYELSHNVDVSEAIKRTYTFNPL
jgi:hypothetical protein